jgi:hypothetical protein
MLPIFEVIARGWYQSGVDSPSILTDSSGKWPFPRQLMVQTDANE